MNEHHWELWLDIDEYSRAYSDIRIIDRDSKAHPQGPRTIAKINCLPWGPNIEGAVIEAQLMLAAPKLLQALRMCIQHLDHNTPEGELALESARLIVAEATEDPRIALGIAV